MTVTLSRRELLRAASAVCLTPAWNGAQTRPLQTGPDEERRVTLPPIRHGAIARRVVQSLQPSAGERAVLVYDPTYYPELAQTIQAELQAAGVYPVVALTFEPLEMIAGRRGSADARARQEAAVTFLRSIFERSQIFLWLPARALEGDLRWEKLLDGLPIRGIHFHWIFGPLAPRSPENIRTLSQMYERAILDLDYAALSGDQDRLISRLRGQTIRITNADGTDLRIHVPQDAWFHKSDGDASPARIREAKSVRDHEIEFPPGAVRFIPDSGSVEGTLAVAFLPGIAEGVTLEFERGRAVRQRAVTNDAAFRKAWETFGGDIDTVGEIVLGMNPLLAAELPSGEVPYAGFGAGALRVSMGDNWESGGTNRSSNGRPMWLFPRQVTVEAGSTRLITRGVLAT